MNDDKWSKLKKQYYRSNTVSQIDDGTIDFSLDDYHKLRQTVTASHTTTTLKLCGNPETAQDTILKCAFMQAADMLNAKEKFNVSLRINTR